jgi:hypothetical protein
MINPKSNAPFIFRLKTRIYSYRGMASFLLSGKVARARIQPLLPTDWKEKEDGKEGVDFLWENTPRRVTQPWRDGVRCYSHLPNGLV